MSKTTLGFIVGLISIIFIILQLKCKSDARESLARVQLEALNDSLTAYKDSEGELVSKIKVITSERDLMESDNKQKDEYLEKLMRFVGRERDAKEALVAEIATLSEGTIKTEVVYKYKEVELNPNGSGDSITYLYPTYHARWNNKWGNGFILATKDSIQREIEFTNEFEIWETEKNVGTWLNPVMARTIHWKNLNPNSTTKGVRKWETAPKKPKRFVLMIGPNLSINSQGKVQGGFGVSAGVKIFEK